MSDYVGQQLGGYTLTKKLGDGGFADVYLGEHIYLDNKKAAIKVLKGTFAEQDIKKFHKEAQIIHRLQHPHIVRVIDFNVTSLNDQQVPFLVMEHAPHGSLREQHQRGTRLPLATIISYVKPIATALQYAHNQKVIHRDIKPANLLLGENKELLLSDFGNAVMAHSTQSMPEQDNTGTWAYMAPEQFTGKPRLASDQYALGIVIYQWLSGELPFAGPNFDLFAYQHAIIAPPPLDKKVLPAVEAVVLQALAKDPHQRFNSVKAFAIALEQASELALSVPLVLASGVGTLKPQPLDQLWYTWSTSGLGSMSMGYRVRAASEGLYDTQGMRYRRVDRFLRYELPQGININEFDARTAPISFAFVTNGDESLLMRKVFKGRDLAGHNSVYFTHLIAGLPREFPARYAIRLWHCPRLWVDSEQEKASNDTQLPKIAYSELITLAQHSQTSFNFTPISEQLKSLLQLILSQSVRQGVPPHIYVTGQPMLMAALIYGLTHCLPMTMLKGLTFSTYESNASESEINIVGTMSGADLLEAASLRMQPTVQSQRVSPDIQTYVRTAVTCLVTGNMEKFNKLIAKAEEYDYQTTDPLIELFKYSFRQGPLAIAQMEAILTHPADFIEDLLDPAFQQESAAFILNQPEYWEGNGQKVFTQVVNWIDPAASPALNQATHNALTTFISVVTTFVRTALQEALLQVKDRDARHEPLEVMWAAPSHRGQILCTLAPPVKNAQVWFNILSEFAQKPFYDYLKNDALWEFHRWLLDVAKKIHPQPTLEQMMPWLDIPSWDKLEKVLIFGLPAEWEYEAISGRIRNPIPKAAVPVVQKHEAKFKEQLQRSLKQENPQYTQIVVQFFQAMVEYEYPDRVSLLLFLLNTFPKDSTVIDRLFSVVRRLTPHQLVGNEIDTILAGCQPEVIAACGSSPALLAYIQTYILFLTPNKLNHENVFKLLNQLNRLNQEPSFSLPDTIAELVKHWFVISTFLNQAAIHAESVEEVKGALQHILRSLRTAQQEAGENRVQVVADEFFPLLVRKVKSESDLSTIVDILGEQIVVRTAWKFLYWMALLAGQTYRQRLYRLIPYLIVGVREHARSGQPQNALDDYLESLFGQVDDATLRTIDGAVKNSFFNEEVQTVWNAWYERLKASKRSNKPFGNPIENLVKRRNEQPQKQSAESQPGQQVISIPESPPAQPASPQQAPVVLSAPPGYPATIQEGKATTAGTNAPQFVAVLKKYDQGILFYAYQKTSLVMQQILPYWYSELLEKQKTKSPSQSLLFEVNAVYQLLQELLMPDISKLSRNLILYLVDNVLIQKEIQAVIQEGKVTDQIFNPERYIAAYLTGFQRNLGLSRYQQLCTNPYYTQEDINQAFFVLIRRDLFRQYLEERRKHLQDWLDGERKKAKIDYYDE